MTARENGLPPGPRLPAVAQTARWLTRLVPLLEDSRRRFGPTFTLCLSGVGPLVMISDPPSIKRLFGADRSNRLPPGRGLVLEPVLGPRSLLLLQGEEHMRRRRLMLPPFHGERMRAYEATIAGAAESDLAGWPLGRPFPLLDRMQAITLEVILRAVFGVSDPERLESLRAGLRRVLAETRRPAVQVLATTRRRLGTIGPYRQFQRLLDEVDELLAAEIAARRSDPDLASREDILSMLIGAELEDGERLDDAELRDQLMTLLLAGHETTATGLAWAFDLLLRHPEALSRATEEARSGGSAYLDAVASEALRVRPVVPNVGRELTSPDELGGFELDTGTAVMPSIYLVHTRPDLYAEPYAFRPERFLDGGPETYSWIPFGGGTRRCLGASFASFEMRVVLRTVLSGATLRPAGPPERPALRGVVLAPRNGTPVVLER